MSTINTNSADFGASNTNKSLTKASSLGITHENITVNFWVKLNAEISSSYWVFHNLRTTGGGTNYIDWIIYYDYNGGTRQLTFSRTKPGVGNSAIVNYPITLGTTNFYMITMTYDTTTMNAYVNGANVGTSTASGVGSAGTNSFNLGFDGASQYASILLDDVRIYNTPLGSSTIAGFYNSPSELVGNEANLQAYYTFNTSLTTDLTANAFTLTNNNTVTQNTSVPFASGILTFLETITLTDIVNAIRSIFSIDSEVSTMSDSVSLKVGWGTQAKNSSTWTNLSKS